MSPRPAATDLVPRRPVGAAEEGGWQWLEASLWEVVPLLSRSQPSSRVLRSRCRRRAPGGAGCNRGCLSPPERPRRWAGAEQTQSLRRRLPPLLGCPAARLPQCIWGAGGRWAPGRGGGGGCGAGQTQPPIPAAGEPRAPGAPASLGLSHGDLCKRQHSPRLLQPRRRNHSDRGCPPGERSGRTAGGGGPARAAGALSERGGSPGPGCGRHRVWPAWLGGLQGKATHWRAPTRHLGGAAGLSWDSGMKANCFPCSPAALEEALELATRLPAHFQGFFLYSPLSCPSPIPPFPRHWLLPPWRGVGPGRQCVSPRAGRGRRFVAAAVSCRDATAVGESGTGARRTLETAGCARALHYLTGRRAAPPPPLLLGSCGSQFLHARKRTLGPTLRRLLSAGSQPGRALALEWGKG